MRSPVVVVGAGFGGLTAAVELAVAGVPVVVYEGAGAPGGKARSIDVAGRRIDVGPTVLTMRWVFDELFARAGRRLEDAVVLHRPDVVARHSFADGTSLDLFADVARTAAAIEGFAGAREADAYVRFAEHSRRIWETVREPFLLAERPSPSELFARARRMGLGALARIDAHRTLAAAIGSFFRDARLRALFARYATYVGSSPYDAPGTFALVAHVEREGVHVVEGGISRLAAALAELAESLGVVIEYGAKVVDVLVESGRAAGVVVEHARGGREVVAARGVIANADVSTIASGALGASAASAVTAVPRQRRSLSALTFAMVGTADGFPLAHHNVFFPSDYAAEHAALFDARAPRIPDEPTVYLCAQDRAEKASRGPERFFAILNAPADADVRPLDPREVERCERWMMERLERAGARLSPAATSAATPTLFERLSPGTGGAIYGAAAHGPFAPLSRASSATKLLGLRLAGGSVHPGPGVPMAATSGCLAARATLADLASTARSTRVAMVGSTSTG